MSKESKDLNYLGEFEHIVLLSIMQLDPEAHGAPIRRMIEERCSRPVSFGALYSTLRRLRGKGFVRASQAPGASGHSRQLFSVTRAGRAAVEAAQGRLRSMARGLMLSES
ncbi:MAG: PadR family transcriptional regulator [Gemmatimonadota bacterium]|nr:PadR family transcriptional regulator [Gemmatimonadota bacterium]